MQLRAPTTCVTVTTRAKRSTAAAAVPDWILPCHPPLFLADMWAGGLVLHGWRDGPTAYLSPSDAIPLWRELAAAFHSTEAGASRGEQG
jgi:hypothetical protein